MVFQFLPHLHISICLCGCINYTSNIWHDNYGFFSLSTISWQVTGILWSIWVQEFTYPHFKSSILQRGTLAACQAHSMRFKKPCGIFGMKVLSNALWVLGSDNCNKNCMWTCACNLPDMVPAHKWHWPLWSCKKEQLLIATSLGLLCHFLNRMPLWQSCQFLFASKGRERGGGGVHQLSTGTNLGQEHTIAFHEFLLHYF